MYIILLRDKYVKTDYINITNKRDNKKVENIMSDIKKIKDTEAKIVKGIKKSIKNKINLVKGKIYKAQVEAENKASGLSMNDIRNELQFNLYSTPVGKFLISFCQYIMYILVCCEIILFFFRESTDNIVVNLCMQLGVVELFGAAIIGCICYIKNRPVPIIAYTIITAITYFLRLTEHSNYNIINIFISACMSIITVCIIREIIKSKETKGIKAILSGLVSDDEEYSQEVGRTAIMMRCPKCGTVCAKDDNFCVHCGEMIRLQTRVERNSKKSVNNKATKIIKKSIKKANNAINSGKNNANDNTIIMKDIEKKIIRNTED